jgi:hypothetical protein
VNSALESNTIPDILISSAGESTKNCFVLAKSKIKTGTLPKIHFTFYGDSQLIVTLRLNSENGHKKLLYSGKYNCDGSSFTFGKLKYKGVFNDGKTTYENKGVVSGGFIIQVSVAESTAMNIKEGDLMMKDAFTYWLYHNGIFMRNVLKVSLTDTDIYNILKK